MGNYYSIVDLSKPKGDAYVTGTEIEWPGHDAPRLGGDDKYFAAILNELPKEECGYPHGMYGYGEYTWRPTDIEAHKTWMKENDPKGEWSKIWMKGIEIVLSNENYVFLQD